MLIGGKGGGRGGTSSSRKSSKSSANNGSSLSSTVAGSISVYSEEDYYTLIELRTLVSLCLYHYGSG